jgi:hypothetical protein
MALSPMDRTLISSSEFTNGQTRNTRRSSSGSSSSNSITTNSAKANPEYTSSPTTA